MADVKIHSCEVCKHSVAVKVVDGEYKWLCPACIAKIETETDSLIERYEPESSEDEDSDDQELRDFRVRVSTSGTRDYIVRARNVEEAEERYRNNGGELVDEDVDVDDIEDVSED